MRTLLIYPFVGAGGLPLGPFQFHCALSCSYQPQSMVEFVQGYYPLNLLNFSAIWLAFTAFLKYQPKTLPNAPVLITVALAVVNSLIRDFLGLLDQLVHGVVIQLNARFASIIFVVRVDRRNLVLDLRNILS